jgi:penicillin-binding protein 2
MSNLLQKSFQRRSIILAGIKGSLLLGLVGRLYTLQIVHQDHFQTLSDKNRLHKFIIIPDRGLIVDWKNNILAESNNEFFSLFDRDHIKNFDIVLQKVQSIIHLTPYDLELIQKQLLKKRSVEPILIKNNLSVEEMYTLEVHLNELIGLRAEKIRTRFYPDPLPLTHVLGFVGTVSEKDREKDTSALLKEPGFKIGKTGLEKRFDLSLRGKEGEKKVEVNAYRKIVRTLSLEKSIPGDKLTLTIDLNLQKTVYNLLEPYHSGACTVMDAHTGEVRAFVSYPGFDGNLFSRKIHQKAWDNLAQDPYRPLVNKLTTGLYAPGSIFKMMIALSALEKGITKDTTSFHCPGHFDLNGHKFHCWSWKSGGHGTINLTQALGLSCDVYFYHLALKLNTEDVINMAEKFGFGLATGIEYPDEKKGLLPTLEWQKKYFKRPWRKGDLINLSIGQGMLLVTPLQLARMTAAIVNGGRLLTPRLLETTIGASSIIDVNKDHLSILQKGMYEAVNQPYGTAYGARIEKPGFEMAGKTSSTQVSRITEEQRKLGTHNDRPWHLKEHALFVGYAPFNNPRFIISVILEHGGSGGRHAAPLAKEILLKTQDIFKL